MKIGYLITRMDEWGGAQVHVRDLAVWMKTQGIEVVVLSGMPGGPSNSLKDLGIEYIEVPYLQREIDLKNDLKAVKELRGILKTLNLDLLTCHSSKAGLVGRIAAKTIGLPVIFTAHTWTFGQGVSKKLRPIYWFLEWFGAKMGSHIITVSEYGRHQALNAYLTWPENITSIHNGMPDRPRRTHSPQIPARLTMVARVGWPKEHELVLKALGKCQNMSWVMNFVGGGDTTRLQKIAEKLKIADRVNFMGERNDVADILENQTDIFLLISQWEGFPLSTLEAMRSSLPVIVSDAGGASEAIEPGETGYVIPVGDGRTLIQTLMKLIPDGSKQRELGEAGRDLFERYFTFDVMARRTLELYKKILAGG
jgi:glycosyltransferase involved in cell wall biosynthesis